MLDDLSTERTTPIKLPSRHPRSMSRFAIVFLIAGLTAVAAALSIGTYVMLSHDQAPVDQQLGEVPTSPVAIDPEVQRGCAAVKWEPGQTTDVTKDPTAMETAGRAAAKSAVEDVRNAGEELTKWAVLAWAAKGSYNELSMSVRLQTAVLNLRTACLRAGY